MLDTDGHGRSDTAPNLRWHCEVDRNYVAQAAVAALTKKGKLAERDVRRGLALYDAEQKKPKPLITRIHWYYFGAYLNGKGGAMLATLRTLLSRAERSPQWNSNSKDPWTPLLQLLEGELDVAASAIHATKIQRRSPKKSLWQGRLHRDPPVYGLLLAVDDPVDDGAFDSLSSAVEDRFLSPSVWADACLVLSNGELIGCVERDGVGLADWLAEAFDIGTAICSSDKSQMELGQRINNDISQQKFVSGLSVALRSQVKHAARDYLAKTFKLNTDEVLCSLASEPPNAAKGRWEGTDMDPTFRYRIAVVGAKDWAWDNAALELMHRMQPPDLRPGFALLCAKYQGSAGWSRFRAFVSEDAYLSDELMRAFKSGGITDVRLLTAREGPNSVQIPPQTESGSALRVRDTDAGEIKYEVSKSKRRVHDFLTNLLLDWAEQESYEILEGSDSTSMYDALVRRDSTQDLLIEVKSSASPGVIRLAVGQLIDYRRVLLRDGHCADCECVLMLPSNEDLSQEMRELLKDLSFSWAVLRKKSGTTLVLDLHRPDGSVEHIPTPG